MRSIRAGAATVSLGAAAVLAATGCVSYQVVRASSLDHVAPGQSSVRAAQRTAAEVVPILTQAFAARGFPLIDRRLVTKRVTYLIFKGPRRAVTTVHATRAMVAAQSNEVGSWFVARVVESPALVDVSLVGKPTLNGQEVCAAGDVYLKEAEYWCLDSRVRSDWPYRWMVTGKEEAEVIRGVIAELALQLGDGR